MIKNTSNLFFDTLSKKSIKQHILYEINYKCCIYISAFTPAISPDIKKNIADIAKIIVEGKLNQRIELNQQTIKIIIDDVANIVCSVIKTELEENLL
jgi:hypothetical protein